MRIAFFVILASFAVNIFYCSLSHASYSKDKDKTFARKMTSEIIRENYDTHPDEGLSPIPSYRGNDQIGVHNQRRELIRKKNKDKYERHLQRVSVGGFDDTETNVNPAANRYYKKKVLKSTSSRTQTLPPSMRYSNSQPRPVTSKEAPISETDLAFLGNLTKNMPDQQVKGQLQSVLANQSQNKKLNKDEYEFLSELSQSLNNPQVSLRLYEIIEKRRKASYT